MNCQNTVSQGVYFIWYLVQLSVGWFYWKNRSMWLVEGKNQHCYYQFLITNCRKSLSFSKLYLVLSRKKLRFGCHRASPCAGLVLLFHRHRCNFLTPLWKSFLHPPPPYSLQQCLSICRDPKIEFQRELLDPATSKAVQPWGYSSSLITSRELNAGQDRERTTSSPVRISGISPPASVPP